MGKTDWNAIAELFAIEQEKTGISAKDWCDANGYNYQSARRYLKTRGQMEQQKKTAQSAQKKMRKPEKSAQKTVRKSSAQNKSDEGLDKSERNEPVDAETEQPAKAKRPLPRTIFKPGNKAAVKHSGYAKYFDRPEYFEDAAEFSLWDELQFTRARVLSVTKNMRRIQTDIEKETDVKTRVELYRRLAMIEQALDRNIARVESIERSLSSININSHSVPKIDADTVRVKADTKRIEAATQKLVVEAAQLSRQENGDVTPMDEIVSDLRDGDSGTLMKSNLFV